MSISGRFSRATRTSAIPMPRVTYRRRAIADLDAIFEFIASENPRAARAVIREVRSRVSILRDHPAAGPMRADLGPGIRVLPVPHRAVVAYVIAADKVEIVRAFYAGQDYEAILRGEADE